MEAYNLTSWSHEKKLARWPELSAYREKFHPGIIETFTTEVMNFLRWTLNSSESRSFLYKVLTTDSFIFSKLISITVILTQTPEITCKYRDYSRKWGHTCHFSKKGKERAKNV